MSGSKKESINSHIEDYLDYYCGLSPAAGFAVLLKGQWGCGKTYFINKYREKIKSEKKKCLYVSLYGMTSFSEIEDEFFQQLHPFLSSKGMAITGKIIKGFLKGTLKFDLDGDKKDDGTINPQIPDINLPEYLKNTDESILIFDDLERCQIDIADLLGYINYFVEHQELKVILVANEDKLLENVKYKEIKEKLIHKTLDVSLDLDGALKEFIKECKTQDLQSFLSNNIILIEELYKQAEYENLRCLKAIILDFERIFQELPDKAKNNAKFLQDFLRLLMAFSIEIKRGTMIIKDIGKLESPTDRASRIIAQKKENAWKKAIKLVENEDNTTQEKDPLEEIVNRYLSFDIYIYDPTPSLAWWQTFFDKGIIDTDELKNTILNSRYFPAENTSVWIRLWHFCDTDISDDEFNDLLKKVELDYADRVFEDLGEIKHITGLFMHLSDIGLYSKTKQQLLIEAKTYIDNLINDRRLNLNLINFNIFSFPKAKFMTSYTSYKGLRIHGSGLKEFKDFCLYIDTTIQSAIEKELPQLSLKLLEIMQKDRWKFYRMTCNASISYDFQDWDRIYCRIPIFKYIAGEEFIDRFLSMSFDDQCFCLGTIFARYKSSSTSSRKKILEELDWIKNIQILLLKEANQRKGKLNGYHLEFLNKEYLNKAIEILEISKNNN